MSGLTERMRKGTKKVHDSSDKLVNLKLALVLTSKPLYAEAISLFEPIYCAIEAALERQRAHPQLRLLFPFLESLRRAPSFAEDIKFYLSDSEIESLQARRGLRFGTAGVRPAAQAEDERADSDCIFPPELKRYLAHLEALEKDCPVALLAYAYHMYMAVFAGGYMIKKIVSKAMALTSDEGVATFTFPEDCDTVSFRRQFKEVVNSVKLSEEEDRRVMEESSQLFAMNNALVATVKDGPSFAPAKTRFLWLCFKVFVGCVLAVLVLWYVLGTGTPAGKGSDL